MSEPLEQMADQLGQTIQAQTDLLARVHNLIGATSQLTSTVERLHRMLMELELKTGVRITELERRQAAFEKLIADEPARPEA